MIDTLTNARNQISDFHYITMGKDKRLFNPADVRDIYLNTKKAIQAFLNEHDPRKSVVITHFPPSLELRNPNFKKIELTTSYFSANCDDLIERYKPRCWLYGHHHCRNAECTLKQSALPINFVIPLSIIEMVGVLMGIWFSSCLMWLANSWLVELLTVLIDNKYRNFIGKQNI